MTSLYNLSIKIMISSKGKEPSGVKSSLKSVSHSAGQEIFYQPHVYDHMHASPQAKSNLNLLYLIHT